MQFLLNNSKNKVGYQNSGKENLISVMWCTDTNFFRVAIFKMAACLPPNFQVALISKKFVLPRKHGMLSWMALMSIISDGPFSRWPPLFRQNLQIALISTKFGLHCKHGVLSWMGLMTIFLSGLSQNGHLFSCQICKLLWFQRNLVYVGKMVFRFEWR